MEEIPATAAGGLKLELDEALSKRLVAAAAEAGRPAADYAAELIGDAPDDEWSEADRRWIEYEKTGESVPLEDFMAEYKTRGHNTKTRGHNSHLTPILASPRSP